MFIVAMTTRIWPKMMSFASSLISGHLQTKHALGRVLHHPRFGRDADGEGRGRVDAYVLFRERALEIDLDRHGGEIEELIILDDRPDEGGAAVQTMGRLAAAHFAVNHEDAIGWAFLVARGEGDQGAEDDNDRGGREEEYIEIGGAWSLHR